MSLYIQAVGKVIHIGRIESGISKKGVNWRRRHLRLNIQMAPGHTTWIRCTFWNEKINLLDSLQNGDRLKVAGPAFHTEQGNIHVDIEQLHAFARNRWFALIPPADQPQEKTR